MTGPQRRLDDLPDFEGRQACLQVDPELFFPSQAGQEQYRAREVADLCGGCPVAEACLEYALAHSVEGIWAGTTTAQRRRLRRRAQVPNAQQQRLQAARRTVTHLHRKGCTPAQIIAQTGLHEQTVWRILRRLDTADSTTRAA